MSFQTILSNAITGSGVTQTFYRIIQMIRGLNDASKITIFKSVNNHVCMSPLVEIGTLQSRKSIL